VLVSFYFPYSNDASSYVCLAISDTHVRPELEVSGIDNYLEIAKQGRAGCQNGPCKSEGIKIGKGEFRLGIWVTFPGSETSSFRWKHWYASECRSISFAMCLQIADLLKGDVRVVPNCSISVSISSRETRKETISGTTWMVFPNCQRSIRGSSRLPLLKARLRMRIGKVYVLLTMHFLAHPKADMIRILNTISWARKEPKEESRR